VSARGSPPFDYTYIPAEIWRDAYFILRAGVINYIGNFNIMLLSSSDIQP
jgi:hypothetical protein